MPDLSWRPYPGDPVVEPTTRRRCVFVVEALRHLGWDVSTKDMSAPIAVLQRIATPADVRTCQASGSVTIFEQNDNLLDRGTMFHSHTEAETVATADYVVVTCRYMQRRYARVNPNCLIAPEILEPEFWTTQQPDLPKEPLVLSWVGMPDNLQYLESTVLMLAERVKDIRLRIITSERDSRRNSNRDRVAAWPVPTDFVVWQRETFVQEMANAHAGIVALPDTLFCRCKGQHKAISYFCLGLPCIASNVPGYREVIEHGATGLLANTDEEWVDGIEQLRSAKTRKRIGERAREFSLHFTQEAVGALWDRMLSRIREEVG